MTKAKPAAGIFGYLTKNLGDDMQSLAALAHLARVDGIYPRDDLHVKPRPKINRTGRSASEIIPKNRHPKTTCIFNSWFKLGTTVKAPHRVFDPIMFGVCIGKPELLDGAWRDYLAVHAPIPCRDRNTVRLLRDRGIDATFSACLTLRIGQQMPRVPESERRGVLVVDVDEGWLAAHVDPTVWRDAEFLSMNVGAVRARPFSRLKLVSDMLKRLSTARLVITRRLHAGSPATSLGTPVLFVPERGISRADERFTGWDELVRFTFQDAFAPSAGAPIAALTTQGIIAPHAEADAAYRGLRAALARRSLLAERPLSWDYPERLPFVFDTNGWPQDADLIATCGWAEQAMAVRARHGNHIEATLPGFLGYDRFQLKFFVETPDGAEVPVSPLGDRR